VKEWNGRVIFLRRLVEGGTSRSYGIEVARIAGLPPDVIGRAREVLENLEGVELDDTGTPRLATHHGPGASPGAVPGVTDQLGLFAHPQRRSPPPTGSPGGAATIDPVREKLRALDLDTLTPLEALNLLHRIKSDPSSGEEGGAP
jgi:DNA mismatch repair protein MutS